MELSKSQRSLRGAVSSASSPAVAAVAPAPALRVQAHEEPTHAAPVAHSERADVTASSASTGATSSSSAATASRTNKRHAAAAMSATASLVRSHELLATNGGQRREGEERRDLTQSLLPAAATSASAAGNSSAAASKKSIAASVGASASGERVLKIDEVPVDAAHRRPDEQQNLQTHAAASAVLTEHPIAIAAVPPPSTRTTVPPAATASAAAAPDGDAADTGSGRHESSNVVSEALSDPRTIITTTRHRAAPFNSFDRAIIRTQLDHCLSRIIEENRSKPFNAARNRAMELFRRFKRIEGPVTPASINANPRQDSSIWDKESIAILLTGWPRQDSCVFGYCRNYEFHITGAYLQNAILANDVEYFFLLDVVCLNGLLQGCPY